MQRWMGAALVIAGAILGAAALLTYFSPYQSCVRARSAQLVGNAWSAPDAKEHARIMCAGQVQ